MTMSGSCRQQHLDLPRRPANASPFLDHKTDATMVVKSTSSSGDRSRHLRQQHRPTPPHSKRHRMFSIVGNAEVNTDVNGLKAGSPKAGYCRVLYSYE